MMAFLDRLPPSFVSFFFNWAKIEAMSEPLSNKHSKTFEWRRNVSRTCESVATFIETMRTSMSLMAPLTCLHKPIASASKSL